MQRLELSAIKAQNILRENQIAHAMLWEAISNKKIKSILKKISMDILTNIVNPIKSAVYDKEIKSVDDLPSAIKKSVEMLAGQNISAEEPFGAVLKNVKDAKDVTCSIIKIQDFISAYESTLNNIDQIDDVIGMLRLLKSIADLCFCYFEYYKDAHSPEFNSIKDMIWLTPEECDGRILRIELEQKPMLALTYGIGVIPGIDVVPAETGKGIRSGKAVFSGASLKTRLDIIAKQYDEALSLSNQLESEIDKTEDFAQKEALHIQWKKHNEDRLKPALEKMQYYHIDLVKSERKTREDKTTFEKLVTLTHGDEKYSLPLVANLSRSTARTLISLLDIHAFQDDKGNYDIKSLQIFSNCITSFYGLEGHHTISEVAEEYCRSVDYMAIAHPEKLPKDLLPSQPVEGSYMTSPYTWERYLPYYYPGNYMSFFSPEYADRVCQKRTDQTIDLSIKNVTCRG